MELFCKSPYKIKQTEKSGILHNCFFFNNSMLVFELYVNVSIVGLLPAWLDNTIGQYLYVTIS